MVGYNKLIKRESVHMRVDRALENILYKINYERHNKGLKALSGRQFTARIANKYKYNEALIHDEFIKI